MRAEGVRQAEPAVPTVWERRVTAWMRDLVAHDESGSAVAEMAFVVIPLMVLMLTGMVWFGIALNNDLALNNAVQAGSEQLALLRGNAADPCASTVTVVENAAPGLAASNLTFAFTLGGTAYTTTCNGITMTSGETAVLTVTYPVTLNIFQLGSHTYTLSATTTELIQ
jgi:Flp pilus assembly protein TadG